MANFADWFVNLSVPSAMYVWLVIVFVVLICAAGVDYLLDQAFPEDQQ